MQKNVKIKVLKTFNSKQKIILISSSFDKQTLSATAWFIAKYVDFKGEKLTFNKWGQKVTGWSSIRIYDWVLIKGNDKTLHEMRQEKRLSLENKIE